MKHNKKRNTAFLFEALVREMTRASMRGDKQRKDKILGVIKEHFSKGSLLYKELNLYKSIYETKEADPIMAMKIIVECRNEYKGIDKKELFKKQSFLISEINKTISQNVYNAFVPNYRSLASIAQLFSDETTAKSKVLLEEQLVKEMTYRKQQEQPVKQMDEVAFRQYVKVFNREYSELLPEQKNILGLFMTDHNALVSYLNEEIERLRGSMTASLELEEIKSDQIMTENAKKIIHIIDQMGKQKVNEQTIIEVLKIQKLVSEIESNDD